MNKKFKITRIAAYIISIIIVAAVIFSHGTLTPPRIVMAVLAILIGVPVMLFLDRIADKKAYEPAANPEADPGVNNDTNPATGKRSYSAHGSLRFSSSPNLKHFAILLVITAAAAAVRIVFYPFASADYVMFQVDWHATISGHGFNSLGMRFGDYSPLYSTVFALLCQTGLSVMFITKFIPMLFDLFLAIAATAVGHEVMGGDSTFVKRTIIYGLVLLNPLTVLNASCWAQCDSMYTTFVLLCLYVLIRCCKNVSRYGGNMAVIFLAIAFSLKFQTVLFFPFIFFVWLMQPRKYVRVTQAVWFPVIYFATCIPMFLYGRTIEDMLGVYFGQMGEYDTILTLRYPNIYTIMGLFVKDPPYILGKLGMLFTAVILVGIYLVLFAGKAELTPKLMLKTAGLSVLIAVYFLPSMHERYAYIGEMLILVIAVLDRKYIIPAVATITVTLFAYIDYLLYYYELKMPPDIIFSLVRLAVIVFMILDVLKSAKGTNVQSADGNYGL